MFFSFRLTGDLKPENLLFTSNADDAILKLTDFGFAKQGMKIEIYSIDEFVYLFLLRK